MKIEFSTREIENKITGNIPPKTIFTGIVEGLSSLGTGPFIMVQDNVGHFGLLHLFSLKVYDVQHPAGTYRIVKDYAEYEGTLTLKRKTNDLERK
jgi:hypothetical protein